MSSDGGVVIVVLQRLGRSDDPAGDPRPTYRHALARLLDRSAFVVWERAPAEVLILRPAREDKRILTLSSG